MSNHVIDHANAGRILDWILHRGGILIWNSVNLSNPGASWTTPAQTEDGEPMGKPNWQCANEPARHITDASEVDVTEAVEVKRFHVATRQGRQGMSITITDGGTRRIEAAVAKAEQEHGKSAWYDFDYGGYNNAVILVEGKRISLADWKMIFVDCNRKLVAPRKFDQSPMSRGLAPHSFFHSTVLNHKEQTKMEKMYRVSVRSTSSLQPTESFWDTEVLYCGYDRDEARREYHRSEPQDANRSFGNPARETRLEVITDAETEDFSDDPKSGEQL